MKLKTTRQGMVNGATLLGTAISLFAFDKLLAVVGWKHWAFFIGIWIFLICAFIEFIGLRKETDDN